MDIPIYIHQDVCFLHLTALFINIFPQIASQNVQFPHATFDDFYMKHDAGLPSEVPTSMDNSQMIQNTGFNSQGLMPPNAMNDGSAGIQITNCIVGQNSNGGIYETAAGRSHNTIAPSAEVW